MRAIMIAAFAGALAAGAAYAHTARLSASEGEAVGTLACTTKPELTLVFGTVPVAECTFAAYRGGFRQGYVGLLHTRAGETASDVPQTIVWRVTNTDGFARPGMLDGVFSGVATNESGDLTGRMARLRLLTQTARTGTRFAAGYPRVALVAASKR